MSIQLTGTGGWFTRQGLFAGAYNYVASLYGSAITSDFQAIWAQFATSDQAAVQNLPDAVTAFRQTGVSYQNTLVADGTQAAILQANDNIPLVPYTFPTSITQLATQMDGTSQSIQRPTLTAVVTDGASNIGNTKFALSTTNIYGDPLDMTTTETFTATCTSQGSGFQASFSILGEPSVTPNSFDWPQGSGIQTSITSVDPAVNGIITDGGFANWTGTGSNTPVNWDIVDGDSGVTVFKAAGGGVRAGTDAAMLKSDGSQATQLAQDISVQINTVYAVTFQAKINTVDASGSFIVSFTDGDGNILQDDAGTDLSYTRNLNGQITTSYQQFIVFFSTPRQLPSTVQLQIGYGSAPTANRELTIDLVQVFTPVAVYGAANTGTRGPWIAAVANTDPSAVGDTYALDFTNNLTTKSFVLGLQRLYDLRSQGLYLPSANSPTISDSLVSH